MARAANATKTRQLAAAGRRPGRSPAVAAKTPAKLTKTAATTKPAPIAAVNAKVSKDELRAQVEKLERANATLRTKSREANRTAKMNGCGSLNWKTRWRSWKSKQRLRLPLPHAVKSPQRLIIPSGRAL
jgi:hypothetical protein